MAAITYKFTTGASTNLQVVRAGQTANVKGYAYVVSAAYPVFVKFYWTNAAPTVGTTIPNLTIECPTVSTAGNGVQSIPDGITGNGDLWVAITKNAGDSDATAVASGDLILTLFLE